MIRPLVFILVGFMLTVAGAAGQAAEVGGLGCDYRVNPQGIDDPRPELNWIIDSSRRGEVQTAYQVLVASKPELLAANQGDLWDSGRVSSSQSAQVEYAGQPLSSRAVCFWKVRIWDRDGKPSAWSQPAGWTMGLLNPADWSAQWISDPILASPTNRPLTPIHCYRSELADRPDDPKWIVLDLGSNQPMDAVDIIPARPKGQNSDFRTAMFPVRFKVEAAEQPDFSGARVVVDDTAADFPNPRHDSCRFSFPAVTARYVRLTVTRLASWDGQVYGLALGGLAVFDGKQSIAVGAGVECSDSMESAQWSKRFLVDGQAAVALADSPAVAAEMTGVTVKSTASRVPMLRREFDLAGKVRRATLYVSARGFYEVRINGKKVGDELLAPGFTDYSLRLQYQTHDVTPLLRPGHNAIGALLGYGWYAGYMNLFNLRSIYGYFPQFLAQLEIELTDGTKVTLGTDGQWRSTLDGPVRWSDLLDGEGYDCRREMPGWDKPGFDDHGWSAAWTQPRDETPLVSQVCQPVRKIAELPPASVREVKPGVYVFDFGHEITGWCRLKTDGPAGTHIRLRHAEMVTTNGDLDLRNLWGVPQQEDYILDGHGPHVFEPHFTYHGFRYVELTGLPGGLKPDTLFAINIRSDLPVTGQFECSSENYDRIHDAAFRTQANLLFDVPAGCAARGERLAWTGDIRPCVQSLSFSFDTAAFLAKYSQDLRDDQSADGRFTDICPQAHLHGTTRCMGSPGWADAGISLPWDLYMNTGDKRLLAEHFTAARRWVDYIHAANPDLIWKNERGMDWGDWLSAGPATPKELGATAFFAHDADLVARMARALGRDAEAQQYAALFQGIRRAFAADYLGTNGVFNGAGDVQGSYALALQFGLLDEPLKSRAVARLLYLIRKNGHHPTTGFWSSVELLLALSANGQAAEAARMVDLHTEPSWGYMAEHGTTFWEAFDANTRNLSLNHWTHSAVNEWLWRNIAGLNPDESAPGYQTFTIRPRLAREVYWCKAGYDSLHGKIVSNWHYAAGKFALDLTVPANTAATVHVPAADPAAVEESGQPAAQADGVAVLPSEPGAAVYRVGSGTYHFTSAIHLHGDDEGEPDVPHVASRDNALIEPAYEHGYEENLVKTTVNGVVYPTLSINNSTSDRVHYSVWTRDLYWGFLGWAQAGDDSVLPVMKSSLRLLLMTKHKNQALGQSAGWPLSDGRFYIPQAYMLSDASVAMGFYPWDSESQADFLLLTYNYWRLSGDRAFIESNWDDIAYVTRTIQLLDTNGNYLPDATEGTYDYQWVVNSEEPLTSAKASLAYTCVARMARALGKDAYADRLDTLAAAVKTALNRDVAAGGLWNPTNGCYVNMRKFTRTGPQVDYRFIPYENLVPMWCGMTSDKQNDSIFKQLDDGFERYYDLKYGPEYCAPVAPHNPDAMDCSSVPWLGFMDVYLRGKTGHEENRAKIFNLLMQHAYDARGVVFSEGAGINGRLTGNGGRTWDNGNFFHLLICGIYGLEKTGDGILLTAPEKIDGVPLTELKNLRWHSAVYDFHWTGEGKNIASVTLDGRPVAPGSGSVYLLTAASGTHEVEVTLKP